MGKYPEIGGNSGMLLGLQEDLCLKLRKGVISLDQLKAFLNRQNPFPEPAAIPLDEVEGRLTQPLKRASLAGSDIVTTPDDCARFMRDYFVITADYAALAAAFPTTDRPSWIWPDHPDLTYKRIRARLSDRKSPVRHYWYADVNEKLDARQPGFRLLRTPAGIESRDTNPELRGVPYNTLWLPERKPQIVSGREGVLGHQFISFLTDGDILLDVQGWTRTGSCYRGGSGVRVGSSGGELYVDCGAPGSGGRDGGSRPAEVLAA